MSKEFSWRELAVSKELFNRDLLECVANCGDLVVDCNSRIGNQFCLIIINLLHFWQSLFKAPSKKVACFRQLALQAMCVCVFDGPQIVSLLFLNTHINMLIITITSGDADDETAIFGMT